MQNSILWLLLFISTLQLSVKGQNVDNVTSMRSANTGKEIRFYYDNDFFTAQDYYYTQGINLEYLHPALSKNPLNFLLIKIKEGRKEYGISVEHNVFTPSSIRHEEVLLNDHPFSAFLVLKSFTRTSNEFTGDVFSTAISIGFIGPSAFGKEMQTSIHTWLKNLLPLGWDHQIRNDLLLNYQINYEKMLVRIPSVFHLSGVGSLNAGTLRDDFSGGVQMRFGKFYDSPDKRSAIFIYGKSEVKCNLFDATLKGGVFNKRSEYTLKSSEVSLLKLQHTIGLNIRLGSVMLEYFQSFVSKEFKTGMNHRYGGISFGYCF